MAKEEEKLITSDKTITLTQAQLDSAITTAVRAALAAHDATAGVLPADASREARIHAELGTPVPDRTPHATTHVACYNEDTGSRFTAVVAKSRTFPTGRVVDLISYRYPDDIGRRSPVTVSKRDSNGDPTIPGRGGLTPEFLQWRWENYDKADRAAYVGKAASRLPRLPGPDGEPKPVDLGETARTFIG